MCNNVCVYGVAVIASFVRGLEVGGVSPLLTPAGKSFRFVRACEQARRGEAAWASESRFDREARAVLKQMDSSSPQIVPVVHGCPLTSLGQKPMKNEWFSNMFCGQPLGNLEKPM